MTIIEQYQQEIIEDIKGLSEDKLIEVADFINFLKDRYLTAKEERKAEGIAEFKFYTLRDREENKMPKLPKNFKPKLFNFPLPQGLNPADADFENRLKEFIYER